MLGLHGIRSRGLSIVGSHDMSRHAPPRRSRPVKYNRRKGIWFRMLWPRTSKAIALAGEIDLPADENSPPAGRRLLDRQQHSKRREATEHGLERAFDAYEAPRNAFADQAPGLEAAAQRIGREREPLHGGDSQRGTEAMKAVALAGGEERRDRLVGVVRVAARVRAAVLEHVGRGANRLVMKEPVERGAAPGDRRLHHEHAPAWP